MQDWTEAREQQLRQMHAEGIAFSVIGNSLGISRNACIGKAQRLGLPSRRGVGPLVKKRRRSGEPKRQAAAIVKLRIIPAGDGPPRVVLSKEFELPMSELSADDIPITQRKQLLELTQHDCRWPYGDPGKPGFFFCGAGTAANSSYCPFHHAVASGYARTLPEAESLARSLAAKRRSKAA